MALQAATSFLPSALSARKEGSVKDSASFLGVRLAADGLKLDTTALGLRTVVFGLRLLLIYYLPSSYEAP
ncbi:hypothetical protein Zm00014a_002736 [Zea mays]|uniref:Uncharacterized protein n=1 Tax=Zea mays TaxID=4577 RepID=A0A3L6EJD6_MAIZE|nr:hypothetical protein Zm00014a_002736 [Zea mays]